MSSYVFDLIAKEEKRQQENIELIASENFVSDNILKAVGSCLTNKYAEGYPAHRYYGGCQVVDEIESYCQRKWQEVFNTDYAVNVQPHSGSQANMEAYAAILEPHDTILSMSLATGGHLSHGSPANFSGKQYHIVSYEMDGDGFIDMDDVAYKAHKYQPKLILAGASAYSRTIDFKAFAEIAKEVGAYFMVDMAHIAGLVATGEHPSPFGLADIITTTVHKTLRGPRGGLIFCKPEFEKKIKSSVFPMNQGGPLLHVIAGKAIAAEEALTPEYKTYIHNVVVNCKAMCDEFIKMGYEVVTGGTDNHLFLLDFSKTHPNISGMMVQEACDKQNITLNKNCVPNEKRSPSQASGVRIGTAAMTTKGYTSDDFVAVAHKIDEIIRGINA